MESELPHELEHNTLAQWLNKTGRQLAPFAPFIGIAVVVLAVGATVYSAMRHSAHEEQREAWSVLASSVTPDGLETVVRNNGDSLISAYAELRLGWLKFNEGKDKIVADRGEAVRLLDEAIEYFEQASKRRNASDAVQSQALLGQALSKEIQGRLDDAGADYQTAVDRYRTTPVGMMSERRLEQLNKPESKEFYASLKEFEALPPSTDLPEKIDANSLPAPPMIPEISSSLDIPLPTVTTDPILPTEEPAKTAPAPEGPSEEKPADEKPKEEPATEPEEPATEKPQTPADPPAPEPPSPGADAPADEPKPSE